MKTRKGVSLRVALVVFFIVLVLLLFQIYALEGLLGP